MQIHFRTSLIFYIEVIDRKFLFVLQRVQPALLPPKKQHQDVCFVRKKEYTLVTMVTVPLVYC